MRLIDMLARCGLVVVVAAAAWTAAPTGAAATDVCPNPLFDASVLPDPTMGVEIPDGLPFDEAQQPLSQLKASIGPVSRVSRIRQIPSELPVAAEQAWVLRFGYAPDRDLPADSGGSWYEAILCVGTRVPQAVGSTVGQTLELLSARALSPASQPDSGWTVQTLAPAPDELVEFGSAVEIVAQPPTSPPPEGPTPLPSTPGPREGVSPIPVEPSTPAPVPQPPGVPDGEDTGRQETGPSWPLWAWLAPVAAAVAAASVWIRHRHRSGRDRTREQHVTTRVHHDAPRTEVREFPGVHPSHTVRIEAHRDDPQISIEPSEDDEGPSPDGTDGPRRR